ncbi:hypothetical protein OKJ48_17650 [Streptomyces kunmingensis]|uniref:Secreted protein n=1 Tax=Streptomyces kunmingensis TaxID=68225 RepID=A0ABU6CBI2_9ACTN|nr:hypothetical protein [Streptomyces kunmingensis]MEB3962058.1 hypothetical protein [Streptomyces kunmingensis]
MNSKGTTVRIVLPLAAAAAVCTIVVASAASDHSSSRTAPKAVSGQPAAAPPAKADVGDPNDPASWRLPIEAYVQAPSALRTLTNVRDDMMDECMSEAGFDNWKPAPDLPNLDGTSFTDGRYGIENADQVAKWGYHHDPALMQAYNDAMSEGAVDETGAPDEQVRQCSDQAGQAGAPVAQSNPLVEQIDIEGYKTSLTEPAVKDQFAKWSACMKAKGYNYAAPPDAQEDPAFNDPETITPQEIATAKDDLACRNQSPVAKTWFDTEVKLQQAAIAKNQEALNATRTANQAQAAKAAKLAQTR